MKPQMVVSFLNVTDQEMTTLIFFSFFNIFP